MLKAALNNPANVDFTGGRMKAVLVFSSTLSNNTYNNGNFNDPTLLNVILKSGNISNVKLSQKLINSAVTATAGATLTAAQLTGGYITRTGPTAAFTDTTDTATAIIAAIPNAVAGTCFELTIINTVAFVGTIAAGVGVTLTGTTTLAASSTRTYLGTVTSATTVELRGISAGTL